MNLSGRLTCPKPQLGCVTSFYTNKKFRSMWRFVCRASPIWTFFCGSSRRQCKKMTEASVCPAVQRLQVYCNILASLHLWVIVAVYATAERADTLPLFHFYPICTPWWKYHRAQGFLQWWPRRDPVILTCSTLYAASRAARRLSTPTKKIRGMWRFVCHASPIWTFFYGSSSRQYETTVFVLQIFP